MRRVTILVLILLVAASAAARGRGEREYQPIRSIRFDNPDVPDAFAASWMYYADNPIGSVEIRNIDADAITDVSVSFEQRGFMDAPTLCMTTDRLDAGESATVPLRAVFNSNVFATEGATPLLGEVVVTYRSDGRPAEQRFSVSYVLWDRTQMVWDDDRKLAAFITYRDSSIREYASWILQACMDDNESIVNRSVQSAIQVYEALREIGCYYQTDRSNVFTEDDEGNHILINSVSLPRDTLRRSSGDYDDLTVLYCALLESIGIETAFILIDDHIFAAFNSEAHPDSVRALLAGRGMAIPIDGDMWIPVDLALVGDEGFTSAWQSGIQQWREARPDGRSLILTRRAQATYGPVGLDRTDLGLNYGDPESVAASFREQLSILVNAVP